MTDDRRTPAAFMISLVLHALVVVILLLFMYSTTLRTKEVPKIFELVAGEGTNYLATEAPALGTPGGVKLTVPAPPTPKPEAPAKVEPPPVKDEAPPVAPPVTKAAPPVTKATPTKAPPTPRTPAQEIRRLIANADRKAKREVAKQREDEQKRAAAAAKVQHIDAAGIAKGVVGGSAANTTGGAGGKALTSTDGNALERYESALIAKLRKALNDEKPPGLSESLVTTVQFRYDADGTLSSVRISKSSGSAEFDSAVRAAIRQVSGTIKPPPGSKSEVVELDFRAKEQDGE